MRYNLVSFTFYSHWMWCYKMRVCWRGLFSFSFSRWMKQNYISSKWVLGTPLLFANSLGFSRIEAESDSLQVINFCSGQTRWWDEAAVLFAECIDICSSIGKVTFKHCLRSCNNVAHVLANHSYRNKSSFSWLDEPPDFLMRELVDDVSVF